MSVVKVSTEDAHKSSVNSDLLDDKKSVQSSVHVSRRVDVRDLKVNIPYCLLMALCGWFGAGHQGFALNLTNATQFILPYALGWKENQLSKETQNTYLMIISTASVVGIALGSISGGNLAKFGRRRMYILFSFIGIVGCIMSMFENTVVMALGRLIYGFSAGIFCVMGP